MTKLALVCFAGAIISINSTSPQPEVAKTSAAASDAPDSPRIAALAAAVKAGDSAATARFWHEMDGRAPLVEPIAGDAKHVRVTFLWRGNERTKRVFLIGGVPGGDETLDRLDGTDLWYLTERIPVEARFGYMFLVDYPKRPRDMP